MFAGPCRNFLSEYIEEQPCGEYNETESNLISSAELQRKCFPSI